MTQAKYYCPCAPSLLQDGWTASYCAAFNGHLEALRTLLAAGANPAAASSVRGGTGNPPSTHQGERKVGSSSRQPSGVVWRGTGQAGRRTLFPVEAGRRPALSSPSTGVLPLPPLRLTMHPSLGSGRGRPQQPQQCTSLSCPLYSPIPPSPRVLRPCMLPLTLSSPSSYSLLPHPCRMAGRLCILRLTGATPSSSPSSYQPRGSTRLQRTT